MFLLFNVVIFAPQPYLLFSAFYKVNSLLRNIISPTFTDVAGRITLGNEIALIEA